MAYSTGTTATTIKVVRTVNLGIRVSGGGGPTRPDTGQLYPRGQS